MDINVCITNSGADPGYERRPDPTLNPLVKFLDPLLTEFDPNKLNLVTITRLATTLKISGPVWHTLSSVDPPCLIGQLKLQYDKNRKVTRNDNVKKIQKQM